MNKFVLLFVILALGTLAVFGQTDTNSFDARKLPHFWAALQGTNAVRVGGFGDSVAAPVDGGKMAGFGPQLSALLGGCSGGITANYPYLYSETNGIGVFHGPDTNWWWYHWYLTNGSVCTYLANTPNGPSGNVTNVWCDNIAVYYLTGPTSGSLTISLSTNGGPFGLVRTINAAGTFAGATTNFSVPLNYYQLKIACSSGLVTLIDCGMWNEHQRNAAYVLSAAPGMAYTDWTSIPTNVTWPIFKAWKPNLLLLEAKDIPLSFWTAFPLLEQMFTNCAPAMDAIYLGTTPQGTNGNPTINDQFALPENAIMSQLASQYGRAFWNSYYIVTYEQATTLGWTLGDATHFNTAGGTALGNMLWSDVWSSFHQVSATATGGSVKLAWYTLLGRSYQAQHTLPLSPPEWKSLGSPMVATNYTMSSSDSTGAGSHRFYRILQLP